MVSTMARNQRLIWGHIEDLTARGHEPGPDLGYDVILSVIDAHLTGLPTADLFWITGQMAQLALSASLDLPEWSIDAAPTTRGLIVLQDDLPPIEDSPIKALSWVRKDDVLWVAAWADGTPDPGAPGPLRVVLNLAMWPGDTLDTLNPISLAVCSFLHAAWTLMMMPTLAERTQLDGEWGGRATAQTRPDRLVTTIDLRPLRHVATAPGAADSTGRVYRHRWLVRGHWTHQPCGPGRKDRQLIYREPYIKGPSRAPLLQTEKVMVWRR